MSLSVERLIRRMAANVGGRIPATVNPIELINEAGQFLVTLHPWAWLERQAALIDLVAGRSYAKLPLNFPDTARDIVAYDTSDSLVNSLTFTDHTNLLKRRTFQVSDTSFNFYAAIVHLPAQRDNLLKYTEDYSNAVWVNSGGVTVLSNQEENPIDGKVTMDKLTGAAKDDELAQTVASYDLDGAGEYQFDIHLRFGDANQSEIQIEGVVSGATTSRLCAIVDWEQNPPTVAISAEAGKTQVGTTIALTPSELMNESTIRFGVRIDHDPAAGGNANTGAIVCTVRPTTKTGDTNKFIFAGGSSLRRVPLAMGATATETGLFDYQPRYDDKMPKGGAPVPVLELQPVPTTSEVGKFAIFYRAGWPVIDDDAEELAIPDYLNAWFAELACEWLRGVVESDNETLSERITGRMVGARDDAGRPGNILLATAMERDAELQTNFGRLQGGAVHSGIAALDWGMNKTVGGPE